MLKLTANSISALTISFWALMGCNNSASNNLNTVKASTSRLQACSQYIQIIEDSYSLESIEDHSKFISSNDPISRICRNETGDFESQCELEFSNGTENQKLDDLRSQFFNLLQPPELAMVQTALLINNPNAPLNPSKAIEEFFGFDSYQLSNGGLITYFKTDEDTLPSGAKEALAKVTYYPGDNEYGAVFKIKYNADSEGAISIINAKMVGSIEDSEISCLGHVPVLAF